MDSWLWITQRKKANSKKLKKQYTRFLFNQEKQYYMQSWENLDDLLQTPMTWNDKSIVINSKSKKTWIKYLKSELKHAHETNSVRYSSDIIKFWSKIKKKVNYIKWQSDFTFSSYTSLHKKSIDTKKIQRRINLKSTAQNLEEENKMDAISTRDCQSQSMLDSSNSYVNKTEWNQDDSGYSALNLEEDDFYYQLQIIKNHLKKKSHPLNELISLFDSEIWKWYQNNLCTKVDEEGNRCNRANDIDQVARSILDKALHFISVLMVAIMKFYNIQLYHQSMWKDLLLNIMTSNVLKDYTYFTIYNVLSLSVQKRLEFISKRMQGLANLRLHHLKVKKIICLDAELRWENISSSMTSTILNQIQRPYWKIIKKLPRIQEIENPILKLEFLFQLFTNDLVEELHEFWEDVPSVSKKQLYIDPDDLRAVIIYILIQSKCSKMLVDMLIIDEFSSESIKMTNRAYYQTVLYSAFEYIEEMNELQYQALKNMVDQEEEKCLMMNSISVPLVHKQSDICNQSKHFVSLFVWLPLKYTLIFKQVLSKFVHGSFVFRRW